MISMIPVNRDTPFFYYNVQQCNRLSEEVYQLELMPTAKERIHYQAGQYIEILLKDENPRPFSIANKPVENGMLELHIRHLANNPYTQQIITEVEQTGLLKLAGPYGQTILQQKFDYPIIFLAGGTGFAPIKALLEQAFVSDIKQPLYLYWGARQPSDLYLCAIPKVWQDTVAQFHFIPVVSDPLAVNWQGRRGLVHDAVLTDFSDLSQVHVYAAGSPEMVYAALHSFAAYGLQRKLMYSDVFASTS